MAADRDAMVLGADSANLSLGGSWTGQLRAEETYAKILERVTKSGMVVVISAGNSGSWYEETAVGSAYADGVSFATSERPEPIPIPGRCLRGQHGPDRPLY